MVYQPEIEKWDGFNFRARFAVSIQEASQPAPTFGVIWLTATHEYRQGRRHRDVDEPGHFQGELSDGTE